ncbi:MAG: ATP-binding cassette domain-containing protein [Desulfobulbaceae bacterium]|nr:ATP-binding cassette domain-containing protein [Desulfobulbaceae bacterium]
MTETTNHILIGGRELSPMGAASALPPLSLAVRAGTVTCLVGPDGSGKSRYLRALAGIDAVRAGQLTLLGRSAYNLDEEEWRRMRAKIAFLGSNTPLLSFFSGWRNIVFPSLYHRLGDPDEIEAQARRLVAELGIDADLEELPAYLDGLNVYKLTIVRALMLAPLVLFLDEPFRRFDICSIRPVQQFLLDRVRNTGLALVTATHDLRFVAKYADRVLFCGDENIRSFASGSEMLQAPFVEVREYIAGITEEATCDDA